MCVFNSELPVIVPLLLLLTQSAVTVSMGTGQQDSVEAAKRRARADTLAARQDSIQIAHDSAAARRRRVRAIALTPELLATAFQDPQAKALLARARATRLAQDSALTSYSASTYERLSANLKITQFGRQRLLLRSERTSHVEWQRGRGAVVDVTGQRAALPMFGGADADVDVGDQTPIPYYPGSEALWAGLGIAKADVSDEDLVNPLAHGAEAYYTYSTGDSLTFQLPGNRRIVVRELRVRPRRPRWDVVVGSLWFDTSSGHLVRAVYRFAEPIDILTTAKMNGEDPGNEIPRMIRPFLTPMFAQLTAVTVEYGLFEGRFWLPRLQVAEGKADIGVMHVPVSVEQHFEYAHVNGTLDLPVITIESTDTATSVDAHRARRLEAQETCQDTSNVRARRQSRYEHTLSVLLRVPCDTVALRHSPELPPSIYASTDTLFHPGELDALMARTLGLNAQAGVHPQPPVFSYGLRYTSYNRIEGVATGAEVRQVFGAGYTGHALVRLGTADWSVNGELGLARSNGRETLALNVYRRLAADSDWDNPFSFGASLSAFLFGRDQGMYYRTWGAELVHTQTGGLVDSWRLFGEQEFNAVVGTNFSLAYAFNHENRFPINLEATKGSVVGLALRRRGSLGENPARLRAFSDVRLEGATGTFSYVRGMADVTLTQPLTGNLGASLTLSGGTSGGTLPTQRLWFLGGTSTVRGQPVASAVGNAYWLTKLELGLGTTLAKPVIFADLGWAGDRSNLTQNVQPISGAGVGLSFLDGLIRFDLAKGVKPVHGVQGSLYVDARF
jgi:hypothetical protein